MALPIAPAFSWTPLGVASGESGSITISLHASVQPLALSGNGNGSASSFAGTSDSLSTRSPFEWPANTTEQTAEQNRYATPLPVSLLIGAFFAVTVTLGALGNALVIWIVLGHRPMRTTTNIFLLNLALADFVNLTLNVPFVITSIVVFHNEWWFGLSYCKVIHFLGNCVLSTIVFTSMAMAIERYSAILYPMRSRLRRTSTLVLAGLTWLCSAAVSAPEGLYATIHEDEGRPACTVDWPHWFWALSPPAAAAVGEAVPTAALTTMTNGFVVVTQAEARATNRSAASSSKAFIVDTDVTIFGEQSVDPLHGLFAPTKAPTIPNSAAATKGLNSSTGAAATAPEAQAELYLVKLDSDLVNMYYMSFLMVVNYIIPLKVLCFAYSRVAFVLWYGGVVGEAAGHGDEGSRTKKKIVKMLICVVIFFSVCWLPMHSYFVITSAWPELANMDWIHYVYMACYWLAMTNSSVNPCIYFYMNARFRMGLLYALHYMSVGYLPCVRWESGTYADYLRQQKSGTVMTTTHHNYSRGPPKDGDDNLLQQRQTAIGRARSLVPPSTASAEQTPASPKRSSLASAHAKTPPATLRQSVISGAARNSFDRSISTKAPSRATSRISTSNSANANANANGTSGSAAAASQAEQRGGGREEDWEGNERDCVRDDGLRHADHCGAAPPRTMTESPSADLIALDYLTSTLSNGSAD